MPTANHGNGSYAYRQLVEIASDAIGNKKPPQVKFGVSEKGGFVPLQGETEPEKIGRTLSKAIEDIGGKKPGPSALEWFAKVTLGALDSRYRLEVDGRTATFKLEPTLR